MPVFSSGSVSISGEGLVQLADGVDNVLSITSGASVSVARGTGDDTITSGSAGNTLDGGTGNDTLIAGSGADTIAFSASYEADTATGFDTTSDTIALTGIGGAAKLFAIDLIQDVTNSDMTLAYDLGTPEAYDFVNTLPNYSGNNAIHVEGADSAALARLSILDAPSTGVRITSSIGVTGDDILVDGAHNKGGSGNGYGLTLYETFNSSFTGLELFNGRHAFVLSAWNAETGNEIHILSTNRDINFHGSFVAPPMLIHHLRPQTRSEKNCGAPSCHVCSATQTVA